MDINNRVYPAYPPHLPGLPLALLAPDLKGEDAATYGIPQKPKEPPQDEVKVIEEEQGTAPEVEEDAMVEPEPSTETTAATDVEEPANGEVEHSANGHTPDAAEEVISSEHEQVS